MKKILYIIGGIILLILIAGIIKFNFINDDVYLPDGSGNYVNNQGKKLQIDNIEKTESKSEDVKVSIVSPDEKEFYSGDSRLWEAKIENFDRSENKDYQCYWTWYVNGEKKWHDLKGCKSTRAVSFNPGNMKVEVKVEFTQTDYSSGQKQIKILDTKTVTKDYSLLSK